MDRIFDDLSQLPEELADAACRLATGGGFGGRELYGDHDEADEAELSATARRTAWPPNKPASCAVQRAALADPKPLSFPAAPSDHVKARAEKLESDQIPARCSDVPKPLNYPSQTPSTQSIRKLADTHKAHLLCLLLLAARNGNLLPNRPSKLGYLIGATELVDIISVG